MVHKTDAALHFYHSALKVQIALDQPALIKDNPWMIPRHDWSLGLADGDFGGNDNLSSLSLIVAQRHRIEA